MFGCPIWAAESIATSTIAGGVASDTGVYLGNARVTLGVVLETFTDAFGAYCLTGVPAGPVRLRVFYTGFPVQERAVAIAGANGSRRTLCLRRL